MAVNYAREYKPDLILLDLDLPDLNGSEVLKNLQSDESVSVIPVIIISANAMPYQIKNLLDDGASEYLTKPLEILNFLRVLDGYLTANQNN
jgi:CheY-like chemotaxis protein